MVLECLGGGDEEIPFQGNCGCEMWLAERELDDLLGGCANWTLVEMNLEFAWQKELA